MADTLLFKKMLNSMKEIENEVKKISKKLDRILKLNNSSSG